MSLLAQDLFDVSEKEKERFKITDSSSLSWVMRKLVSIEKKKAEINALADEEIRRIEEWRKRELSGFKGDEEYFTSLIEGYAWQQRHTDPEFKKASTPYGTVKFRKLPAKWNYDEEKLLESLKSAGLTELIRVKEEPDKATLKKRAQVQNGQVIDPETGAIIEGVTVEEQPDKLVLEVEA